MLLWLKSVCCRLGCERAAGLTDRLLVIGKDCAARLKEPHAELLYDERG